ncbi:redox-sensing transcriptional repressor Rex [bacterium]|nr:redox-sensing transcriptional repressor Rex [bacterium]
MVVNKKCVSRLSRYRKALLRFKNLGFVKVFSDTLGDATGVTPAQVRKDFSLFGMVGKKRGGYEIDALLEKMQVILGKDQIHKVIVVGVGNIGRALIQYKPFEKDGISIAAGFDIDPVKINPKAQVPIYPMQDLKSYIRKKKIEIAILAVSEIAAQEACDLLVDAGITGILNFAPIRLQPLGDVEINTVNLQMELENLIYFTKILKHRK